MMPRVLCCSVLLAGALLFASGNARAQGPEGQQPSQPEPSEEEIMAHFEDEPTVREVQDAAIRYYQVHPDRIRSLRRNAQLKALMPTVSGSLTNSLTTSKRRMMDGLFIHADMDFKENETVNGDSLGFTVSATWALDRLVFNPEMLDVQSLIGILDGLVREVTSLYYIRRRSQIEILLRPPQDIASKISQRIRIEELTGLLDAMTGGFVSKRLEEKEKEKRGE